MSNITVKRDFKSNLTTLSVESNDFSVKFGDFSVKFNDFTVKSRGFSVDFSVVEGMPSITL